MKTAAIALALIACGSEAVSVQRITTPAVQGAQGPEGPTGAAGAAGVPGPGYDIVDAAGAVVAPLASVRFEGSRPVLIFYRDGLWFEVNTAGDFMRSTAAFSESPDCSPPFFIPSSGGVSDADDVAYAVLDWFGVGAHAVLRRDGPEATYAMRSYCGAYPDGSRFTQPLPEEQGSTTGVPVSLDPAPRIVGPLTLRER